MTRDELHTNIAREVDEVICGIVARAVLDYEGKWDEFTQINLEPYLDRQEPALMAEIKTIYYYWQAFTDLPDREYGRMFVDLVGERLQTKQSAKQLRAKLAEEWCRRQRQHA